MESTNGPHTARGPLSLAIGIISDGSGPGRIRDGASLTGRIRDQQLTARESQGPDE